MAGTGMGLSQQMRQKQVLAPQMRQSLEVLQLQVQDLCQLAQQELEQNPTLEEGSVLQDSIDAARDSRGGSDGRGRRDGRDRRDPRDGRRGEGGGRGAPSGGGLNSAFNDALSKLLR